MLFVFHAYIWVLTAVYKHKLTWFLPFSTKQLTPCSCAHVWRLSTKLCRKKTSKRTINNRDHFDCRITQKGGREKLCWISEFRIMVGGNFGKMRPKWTLVGITLVNCFKSPEFANGFSHPSPIYAIRYEKRLHTNYGRSLLNARKMAESSCCYWTQCISTFLVHSDV